MGERFENGVLVVDNKWQRSWAFECFQRFTDEEFDCACDNATFGELEHIEINQGHEGLLESYLDVLSAFKHEDVTVN